jgi:hypothetical protein
MKVHFLRTTVYSSEDEIIHGPSHHLPLVVAIREKKRKGTKGNKKSYKIPFRGISLRLEVVTNEV